MHKELKIGPIYHLQIQTFLIFVDVALKFSKAKLKINGHNAATYIERKSGWRSKHSVEVTGWAVRGSTDGR